MELFNLKRRVAQYQEVLQNTENYRQAWHTHLRDFIETNLRQIAEAVGLQCEVKVHAPMENLEAVVLTLGSVESGLSQRIGDAAHLRALIKSNGALIYQQLFNGKILIMLQYPAIEGYGEPRPPRQLAIYRPEELTHPFLVRHFEDLMREVTLWEDYDDDEPSDQRIGFKMNFEGGKKPAL